MVCESRQAAPLCQNREQCQNKKPLSSCTVSSEVKILKVIICLLHAGFCRRFDWRVPPDGLLDRSGQCQRKYQARLKIEVQHRVSQPQSGFTNRYKNLVLLTLWCCAPEALKRTTSSTEPSPAKSAITSASVAARGTLAKNTCVKAAINKGSWPASKTGVVYACLGRDAGVCSLLLDMSCRHQNISTISGDTTPPPLLRGDACTAPALSAQAASHALPCTDTRVGGA